MSGDKAKIPNNNNSMMEDEFEASFLQFLSERGIQGSSKVEMLNLPLQKKEILLKNHLIEKKKRKNSFWTSVKRAVVPAATTSGITANMLAVKPPSSNDFNNSAGSRSSVQSSSNVSKKYSMASVASYAASQQSQASEGSSGRNLVHDRVLKHPNERRDSIVYAQSSALWYILQISNRNTSMKSLFRHLTELRSTIISTGPKFIHDFVTSIVPHIGSNGITGIASLEIALDRVCAPYLQRREAKKKIITGGADSSINRQSSIASSSMRYADQISPDTIRLQVIKCVELIMQSDFGMNYILLSTGLIRQIIWCHCRNPTVSTEDLEFDLKGYRTYLKVVSLISRIMGPACFLDDGLKNTVIAVMGELQRHYHDPYPFYHLVLSMKSPDGGARKASLGSPRTSIANVTALSDLVTEAVEVEQDEWDYRTQTLVLFNGIVSSGKSITKRMRMRKMLESSGLRNIIRFLLDQNPSAEFKTQADLYNQDRELDLSENAKEYKEKNAADQTKFLQSIDVLFQSIQKLPDPDMISHFVTSTISSIDQIVKKLESESSSSSKEASENFNSMREDIGLALAVVERTTRSLATTVSQSQDREGSSGDSDIGTKGKVLETVQSEFYDAARDVWGDPPSTVTAKSGKIGAIIEELDSTKQKYADAITEKESMQKEIEFLKLSLYNVNAAAGITNSSDVPTDSNITVPQNVFTGLYTFGSGENRTQMTAAQMWEEMQRLQGLVNVMEEERKKISDETGAKDNSSVRAISEGAIEEEKSVVSEKESIPSAPPPPPGAPNAPPGPPSMMKPAQDPYANLILKSKQPMKPLQWEKLAIHSIPNTIWNTLFKRAYMDKQEGDILILQDPLLDPDFLELFSKAKTGASINLDGKEKGSSSSLDAGVKEVPKEIVRFLDGKQGQNMEILLNSFKLSHSNIKDAILSIDDQIMTLDRITRLLGLMPPLDTISQITSYEGAASDMGVPEQFLLTLSVIPRLAHRLECMAFRHLFYQEFVEIDPDIKTVILASQQTQTSSKFAAVLRVVLVVGNYLNGASFRGNARGFKLTSLLNLRDTKSNSITGKSFESDFCRGSTTLLHYIVRVIEKLYPDSLDFISNELSSVAPASKISIPSLVDGVHQLRSGFDRIKQEVAELSQIQGVHPSDKFLALFTNFCKQTDVKIVGLEDNIKVLKKEMTKVFELFAEEGFERHEEPQVFFENITKFANMLKKAKRENEMQDRNAKRALERAASANIKSTVASSVQSSLQDMSIASSDASFSFISEDAMAKGTFLAVISPSSDPQAVLKPVEGLEPFSKRLTVSLPSRASTAASSSQISPVDTSSSSGVGDSSSSNGNGNGTIEDGNGNGTIEEETRSLELSSFLLISGGTSMADARTILRNKQ